MELGICVRDRPADEVARLGRLAEEEGFGHVFLPDLRGGEPGQLVTGRDAFVSLGALFAATSRLRAGVGVAAAIFHDPVDLARAAGTLAESSGGRFTLGLGVSHGEAAARGGGRYPTSPLSTMRWWIAEMNRCSKQGGLDFGAGFPVLLGALGPKMLTLGAQEADGVVLNWLTPEHAARTVERVRVAASNRPTTTVLYVRLSPPAAARDDAVSYDALANYHRHFVDQGLTTPEAIVAGTCLPLDPLAAAERLAAYDEAGVDVVCLYPHGLDEAERRRVLTEVAAAHRATPR
jgi:alkanesulfonate monooxygenase SsuD/methylene tetrahydromethanopterin reductase-like flavin-dependent oxidoreductase (luciferase family)